MSGITETPVPLSHLAVRTQQIHQSDGQVQESTTVHCPRKECVMPLDTCLRCERLEKYRVGPGDSRTVICDAGAPASEEHTFEPSPERHPWAQPTNPGLPAMHPDVVRIGDIMTTNVVCIRGDVTVETAVAILVERHISGMPVVDAQGRAVGMFSKSDLVRHAYETGNAFNWEEETIDPNDVESYVVFEGPRAKRFSPMLVDDLMQPLAFSLPEHAPVSQAAALMAYEGVHRVPVHSVENRIVGMVSTMDVLRVVATSSGYSIPG